MQQRDVAQLVARTAGGREVASSSLVIPTNKVMKNAEYPTSDDDIRHAIEREELIDHYLSSGDLSYDTVISQLEERGGQILFHDSERLSQLAAGFPAGVTVMFSEQNIPDTWHIGILTEDAFLVPVSSIDRPQNLYRPHLCVTIQDERGIVDTLLFPIAKRSDDSIETIGVKTNLH